MLTGGTVPDGAGYFYPPDRPRRRARRRGHPATGDLRTGRADRHLHHRGRGDPLANDTEYGLVSYVYTGDLARGLRVSERIETGMVGLNRGLVSDPAAPFGGVKECGLGREGGPKGLLAFTEPSTSPSTGRDPLDGGRLGCPLLRRPMTFKPPRRTRRTARVLERLYDLLVQPRP